MTIKQKLESLLKIDLIPINEFSNKGVPIHKELRLVIHWPASPKSAAGNIQYYFSNLKTRYASTQFSLDENEIILQIPTKGFGGFDFTDKAYHAGAYLKDYTMRAKLFLENKKYKNMNSYSVGVEVCHTDWNGKMKKQTIENLKILCAYWCMINNKNPETSIVRHYDLTGKLCPRYYVDHPDEFWNFKQEVKEMIKDEKQKSKDRVVGTVHKSIGYFGLACRWIMRFLKKSK